MFSRIMWGFAAVFALVAGMAIQDGDRLFDWSDDHEVSSRSERSIDARVEHAIDGSFDKMKVVGSDGEEVEVPPETKRAMAAAVGELVKAEADLALARIGDGSDKEEQNARARRDNARAEVERLKAEIKKFERSASREGDALREQIRREVREDVRETVREAVEN